MSAPGLFAPREASPVTAPSPLVVRDVDDLRRRVAAARACALREWSDGVLLWVPVPVLEELLKRAGEVTGG